MPFRANEEERKGYEHAVSRLVGLSIAPDKRPASLEKLTEIIDLYGPVVECYPSWHPLVSNHDPRSPVMTPSDRCGYRGLDHSIFLRHAFITCPYGNGEDVLKSVEALSSKDIFSRVATISAERLDVQLYHPNAQPILVKCKWERPMNSDGTISSGVAAALMLEKEVPCWRWADFGETWKTMRPYLLGQPCGSRSSLFVNEETGQQLKDLWNAITHTGMFGPIKVGTT